MPYRFESRRGKKPLYTADDISSGNFVTREITITGVSSRQANDVEEVFQMAQLGRIELKKLITKSYRYDQINEALTDLEQGKLRMGVSLWN